MDDRLKKRLIGATVLVSLVVIFIPMLLQHEPVLEQSIQASNIPPPPKTDFSSRVIPSKRSPAQVDAEAFARTDRVTTVAGPDGSPIQPAAGSNKPAHQVETREGLSAWMIQVGSFSLQDNAEKLLQQLRKKSFAADIDQVSVKGKILFRVLVGPEVDRSKAEKLLERVNAEVKPLKIEGTLKSYP